MFLRSHFVFFADSKMADQYHKSNILTSGLSRCVHHFPFSQKIMQLTIINSTLYLTQKRNEKALKAHAIWHNGLTVIPSQIILL